MSSRTPAGTLFYSTIHRITREAARLRDRDVEVTAHHPLLPVYHIAAGEEKYGVWLPALCIPLSTPIAPVRRFDSSAELILPRV